nr:hypothetical protein [Tanacetum cinerariifolium]
MVELGEVTATIAATVFVVVSGFLASSTFVVAVVHVGTVYAIWPIAKPFLTIRLVPFMGETVSKATHFVLVLAERGEQSNDDGLGIGFWQQLLKVMPSMKRSQRLTILEGTGSYVLLEFTVKWGCLLRWKWVTHLEYGFATFWEQRPAVMATYDAIIEGCTTYEIMSFVGSKRINEMMVETHDQEVQKVAAKVLSMYKKEWKPTLSLVALDVAVGYLPHLWRNDEENVFSVMVGL